jgi:hypothetical protein
MAIWELRLKSNDAQIGEFDTGDVPVPRLGELVMVPLGVALVRLAVVNVHHYPKQRQVTVYVSPAPGPTAGYSDSTNTGIPAVASLS